MRARWMLGAAVIGALLIGASVDPAYAQTSGPTPGPTAIPTPPRFEPGDILWAFAEEPPFYDERVAGALRALMAPLVRVAPFPNEAAVRPHRIIPVQRLGLLPGFIAPAGDVPLLLRAAGFGQTPPFIEVGQCKVWISPPPAGTPSAAPPPLGQPATAPPAAVQPSIDPGRAAAAVTRALLDALRGLGIDARDCVRADSPAEAHLLFWVQGDPAPPQVPQRSEPTFLSWQGYASAGALSPRPPASGNGGPGVTSYGRAAMTDALVVCAALVISARLLTGRTRRSA